MAGLTASVAEGEGYGIEGNTIMRFSGQVNRSNRVRGVTDARFHYPLIKRRKRPFALQPMALLLVAHAVLERRQQVESDVRGLEVFCFGVGQIMS